MEACKQECKNCSGHDKKISRHDFLQSSIPVFGGLWAVMAAYPIYRYLAPKAGENSATKVSSVTVCAVADLPSGTGKNFQFGSSPALVTHTKDGQYHAFKAVCTHLGCTVQFRQDKQMIWCACHGGCYDASTGKNIAGPPPKPLTALKIEIAGDKIVVSEA